MIETIATTLAVEAAKDLTQRAYRRLNQTYWSFDDQLAKLKEKCESIEAFLNSIDSLNLQDKEKNRLVYRWLQKVKDTAYLADQVIDDYALEIIRKTKVDTVSRIKGKINNLKEKHLGFRFDTSDRVTNILSLFAQLDEEARNFGLIKNFENADNHNNGSLYQVRKHGGASGSQHVGRKLEEKKLLEILCKPTVNGRDLSTIAISGIGGLGKTTLAKRLYEHKEVDRHFKKKKVWICVSNNFNVERLLKEMVESLTQQKCDLSNTGAIISKLRSELTGKKFLLVLDDVWNNNQQLWDSLITELQRVNYVSGSMILVTTRSREVAVKARSVYVHELEGLSRDESWDLFIKEFPTETNAYIYFEEIGRKIVEKCKGVPLAIKVIAGILQSKEHLLDWQEIHKNKLWNLPQDNENHFLPTLLLSFSYLPFLALKQCFAYCAIFPKGTLMKKDQLIALWSSQGFLHEHTANSSSLTIEKIGENYIQILLNNSLLQEENDHFSSIMSYKMHDLIHDLASYILKDDLFVWDAETRFNSDSNVNYRHLIFNISRVNEIEFETYQMNANMFQKLRTASIWNGMPRWDFLNLAKYMSTLIMVNIGPIEVPQDIGNLRHLRYLDLSENLIQTLPESICELYLLQTLRILHCYNLTKLPKNLHKLINLRHLSTSNFVHASKRSLQQLTTLQTLPQLELRDGRGWTIDELGHLPKAKGEICISHLEHIKSIEQARKADLGSKDEISRMALRWGERRAESSNNGSKYDDEGVLDCLEPHPNIKSLYIKDYSGVRFPNWMLTMIVKQGSNKNSTQLSNLTAVEFYCCRKLQLLPTLGQLPSLRILKLEDFEDVKCINNEFYQTRGHTGKVLFPALRHLRIKHFPKLTNWVPPSLTLTAFPCLETLEIRECRLLETIPVLNYKSLQHFELENIGGSQPLDIIKNTSGLNSLHLSRIPDMTSLPSLLNCTNLQILEIHKCDNLKSFPTSTKPLVSLKKLRVSNCIALSSLPENLFHDGLHELSIDTCFNLTRLPLSLEQCTSMHYIRVKDCPSIEGLVPSLCMLEGLVRLTMLKSGHMMGSVLASISRLHHLREVEIGGFEDNQECREYFLKMGTSLSSQSLVRLVLRDCPHVDFIPQQLQWLTSIECLYIDSFNLEELPEWIGNLSSLKELRLSSCVKLRSLASNEAMLRLSRLQRLLVDNCPLLKGRCAKGVDSEWVKISRIALIMFDDEVVQDLKL